MIWQVISKNHQTCVILTIYIPFIMLQKTYIHNIDLTYKQTVLCVWLLYE